MLIAHLTDLHVRPHGLPAYTNVRYPYPVDPPNPPDANPVGDHRLRFAVDRVMRTHYRIDDFQETYFVIPDLAALLDLAHVDFAPIYARVSGQPELQPGAVLASDQVLTRGTGSHHQGRRPAPGG